MTRKFLFACEKDGGIIMSLINISDLTFYYDGSYDNIFENVLFQIDSRWKPGLWAEMEEEKRHS